MNDLEMQLHYPLGDALAPGGGTLEVAPGVRWVRMALPFALNHINLWLLRDTLDGVAGWSIVDWRWPSVGASGAASAATATRPNTSPCIARNSTR